MNQEFQSFGTAGPRALRGPLVSSSVAGNEEGRAVCRSAVSVCLCNRLCPGCLHGCSSPGSED